MYINILCINVFICIFCYFYILNLFQDSYDRAKNILNVHHKEHKLLAEALLKYETLDADDIKALLNKKT